MLTNEKAEIERIDKKLYEISEQIEKLQQESEQLWKERTALLERMIKLGEKE